MSSGCVRSVFGTEKETGLKTSVFKPVSGAEGEIRTLELSFKPVENTALFIFMANIVAKLREELFHFLHRLGNVCLCDVCIDFTHCSVV